MSDKVTAFFDHPIVNKLAGGIMSAIGVAMAIPSGAELDYRQWLGVALAVLGGLFHRNPQKVVARQSRRATKLPR